MAQESIASTRAATHQAEWQVEAPGDRHAGAPRDDDAATAARAERVMLTRGPHLREAIANSMHRQDGWSNTGARGPRSRGGSPAGKRVAPGHPLLS